MAGHLELVETPDGGYRVLLVDGDDALMGLSKRFSSKEEAVEGVEAIREVAGTGLLRQSDPERYAVLMLEEPVIDSALAGTGSPAEEPVQAQRSKQKEVAGCGS
ncbi:hypothetical protein [Paenarthrobacter ilicis]|uniref:DUF1508 domain-containing protein n=1 Tax=Paenarthrobacter ilicis TaxID=43665 RepID=A0ABX0TMV8_9MICC|nr:hypothetical protein [Paenarthrobacter ilicis]MBM7794899.1 uncharacterized protein YegP (UPF0339 family) [Paenarthrobacter ilicis]NIJ02530.1 hypothetical protein [Paenarthrobacter ilicis]